MVLDENSAAIFGKAEQAVFVYLYCSDLPDEVVNPGELAKLQGQIRSALADKANGVLERPEIDGESVTLSVYGSVADDIFHAIEPMLRVSPLCQGAKVLIRPGGPKVPGREVHFSSW